MPWRLVPREELSWRELDGELVVRNARTGSTHLLEPLASEVLRTLMEANGAMSVAQVAARLRDEADTTEDLAAAIEAVLSEFERLGLAERA